MRRAADDANRTMTLELKSDFEGKNCGFSRTALIPTVGAYRAYTSTADGVVGASLT